MNKTLKIVWPLSIISFLLFTQWWLVEWEDGGREIIYGFPFPFMASGATSLTFTFFIREFLLDLTVYFGFWFGLVYLFHRYVRPVKPAKRFWIPLWLFTLLLMAFVSLLWSEGPNLYRWKNEASYKVLNTEFQYVGNDKRRRELLHLRP